MEQKQAEIIWETFMSHPSMLMQPKAKQLLRPASKQKNFLGSSEAYKKKFIKAMEKLES